MMEYYLLAFFTVFTCTLVMGLSRFLKLVMKRSYLNSRIPGPKLRPFDIVGDLKHIFSGCKDLPISTKFFQQIGAYAKIFREEKFFGFWFSYYLNIYIMSAEEAQEIFSGTTFNNKSWSYAMLQPWLGDGLLLSGNSKWKKRRKLLTPTFHFDILKDFLPIINEKSQILVEVLRKETSQPWTDIQKMFTLCSLDIICETTLGVSVHAQENSESEYVQAVHRSSNIFANRYLSPLYWFDFTFYLSKSGRQFKKDIKLLHEFTRKIITERKKEITEVTNIDPKSKRKPLLDLLLHHHICDNSFTEQDIREEVDTFTFAGHDTTAAGLSWALYLIGLDKKVQENIHKELNVIFGDDQERPVTTEDLKDLKYLTCVLKESLRLYPSVGMVAREIEDDLTLRGCKIPRGISCFVMPFFIHRDPNVFPNPENFDPDRFLPENCVNRHPYAYIPFSAGPRNCIGQRFALMELKVVIASILRNYKVESLVPRDKVIIVPDIVLKSLNPLKVKFSQR